MWSVMNVSHKRGLPILAALTISFAAGCSSTAVEEVNEVVMARWESLTDGRSRLAINATRQSLPLEKEDYRIGPEDILAISIFEWELREETRILEARVTQTGNISLPVVGEIMVAGTTVSQLQKAVEKILREGEILKQPRVTVEVKEFRSKRVSVVGAVREPGVYTLHRNVTTLLEVLSLAGGPDERAGQLAVILSRHSGLLRIDPETGTDLQPGSKEEELSRQRTTVDLYELLDLGNLSLNMVLQNGDIVHVPEATKFFVSGYVREPGGFLLKRPMTVLDGIALARGLRMGEASPTDSILKRRTPGGEMVIPLDLTAIASGNAPNLFLKQGDIIEVRQTSSKGFFIQLWSGIKSIISVGLRPL